MSGVQRRTVAQEEAGQRLDRWFQQHFPDLPQGRLQKLLRTGQIRVDGKRAKAGLRLDPGQEIRVPPIKTKTKAATTVRHAVEETDIEFLRDRVLYSDDDIIAINKPSGLAVQGGSRTERHLDGMLDALRYDADERPKLIHRLDKDTSGVMVLARSRKAARALGHAFAGRDIQKIYWALVVRVPDSDQGCIDLSLAKRGGIGRERVGVDEDEGKRSITDFKIVERAGNRLAWLALWPRTGRTHQLRAHCAAIGSPILGDGKYGGRGAFVDGLPPDAKQLQLIAREVILPKLSGRGTIRIVAELPPHMGALWSMFDLDVRAAEDPFAEIE